MTGISKVRKLSLPWYFDHKNQQTKFDGSGITPSSFPPSFLAIFHNTEPRDRRTDYNPAFYFVVFMV